MTVSKFTDFFDAPQFDYETLKTKFVDNMNFLKSLTNEEHVLYKKWNEIQSYAKHIDQSQITQSKIWTPRDITNKQKTKADIQILKPVLKLVETLGEGVDWNMLRIFGHTMSFDQNPGRFIRFLAIDETSGKYLGCVSIASDVVSISVRDKWIGWDADAKLTNGRLRNTAIGTCIMAVQPFGYNFLGGKLIASLLVTKPVREAWEKIYKDKLVGLTTTSLYGSHSMYQRIPFWKELGETAGKIALKPDDSIYEPWHHWIKANKPDLYRKQTFKEGISGPITGVKQKILEMIFKEVGLRIGQYTHGFERGVFYALLYENTLEYLRNEIKESELKPLPRIANDVQSVMDWWKPKAAARFEKLYDEDRIKPGYLWYNSMLGMTWPEAKKKFLGEVGR